MTLIKIDSLIYLGQATHMCIRELCYHLFRWCQVAFINPMDAPWWTQYYLPYDQTSVSEVTLKDIW